MVTIRIVRVLILTLFILCAGCHSIDYREHPVPPDFWGKGEDRDLPSMFESVCVPKASRCGDTHFSFEDEAIAISYIQFNSQEEAIRELSEVAENTTKVIRKGSVRNENGIVVGEKIVVLGKMKDVRDSYYLLWTRGSRFAKLYSESLVTIEKYEAARGL